MLAELADVSLDEFLARTDRRNIFDIWQGKAGKGDHFSLHDARPIARAMFAELFDRDVVMLGNGVTAAFGFKCPMFTWAVNGESGATWSWSPHPSGINRWWNEPANRARASAFWRSAINRSVQS